MVLLTPTSITHSGTSASIGANGQVTFTAVTSLSLNGVFLADFDNYVVSMRMSNVTSGGVIQCRLRASGTDASGSDYTRQYLLALSTSVSAARGTSLTSIDVGYNHSAQRNGTNISIYGPFLAQPTAFRNIDVSSLDNASLYDQAGTHSLSTSYDGFTLLQEFPGSQNMTGALQVYGVRS